MSTSVCVVGASGFIGSAIVAELEKQQKHDIYRYSTTQQQFLDRSPKAHQQIDCMIFCAGIHEKSQINSKSLIEDSVELVDSISPLMKRCSKLIFFSSFKTCFNKRTSTVSAENHYDLESSDSDYGVAKWRAERRVIEICEAAHIPFIILCPSHVIGPNDFRPSPNGSNFHQSMTAKIHWIPKCYVGLVDIRNIAAFTVRTIYNNLTNEKILLNDACLEYEEYVKLICDREKPIFVILPTVVFSTLEYLMSGAKILINNPLINLVYFRSHYIRVAYKIPVTQYDRIYTFHQTINDTQCFFRKKEMLTGEP